MANTYLKCKECNLVLYSHDQIMANDHYMTTHFNIHPKCLICIEKFDSFLNAVQHVCRMHFTTLYPCLYCYRLFNNSGERTAHNIRSHNIQVGGQLIWREVESAFNRRVVTFRLDFEPNFILSYEQLFAHAFPSLAQLLSQQLRNRRLLRFSITCMSNYSQLNAMGVLINPTIIPMTTESHILYYSLSLSKIKRILRKKGKELQSRHENLTLASSGWILQSVQSIGLEISTIKLAGGSNMFTVKLDPYVQSCVINVSSNKKDNCFLLAASMAFCPKSILHDEHRRYSWAVQYCKHFFNVKNLSFPMLVNKISKFEQLNKYRYTFNVYVYQPKFKTFPVYKSKKGKNPAINLLMIPNGEEYHYVYINNFHKLFRRHMTKINMRCRNNYICDNCTFSFRTSTSYNSHRQICVSRKPQKFTLPLKGEQLRFQNYKHMAYKNITGYLDFESCLIPFQHESCQVCPHNEETANVCRHKTKVINTHHPCTYSLLIIDQYKNILLNKTESGPYILSLLFSTLNQFSTTLSEWKKKNINNIIMTRSDKSNYTAADRCYICKSKFSKYIPGKSKVRDHNHYTRDPISGSNYLGAAHEACNLNRISDEYVTIHVHNLMAYDGHFIVGGFHYLPKNTPISAVPKNTEQFRCIRMGKYSFVDSFQMLSASLDTLATNLQKRNHSYPIFNQTRFGHCNIQREKIFKKAAFPYEYCISLNKMQTTTVFPPISAFYSRLRGCGISQEEWEHGKEMYNLFQCKTLLEYCNLYCELDVILLAEVFTSFREISFRSFEIDPAYYISLPSYAFDVLLLSIEKTGKGDYIELIHDRTMLDMLGQALRGGSSFVANRFAKIEKAQCKKADPLDRDHSLLYLDVANLYGIAMSSLIPCHTFRWLDEREYNKIDWLMLGQQEYKEGYFIECDLAYPKKLHDSHADFPLCPEHKLISYADLSPYSRECYNLFNKGEKYTSYKLCTTLEDKKRYVIHCQALSVYLKCGMHLTKVHRVLGFQARRILLPFIRQVSKLRAQSKTPFEKMFYKAIANSSFGKSIEDVSRHLSVKIIIHGAKFDKYIRSPLYQSHVILEPSMVAIFLKKKNIYLRKPIAIGISILDLAKSHLYDCYYNYIFPRLGGAKNVSLILTDTDSVILDIRNITLRQVYTQLSALMDFSNHPETHPFYNTSRKAVPGYFKNETGGNALLEIVALKSKCYIYSVEGSEREQPVCKGIAKMARSRLTLNMYKKCLQSKNQIEMNVVNIRSNRHVLTTQSVQKVALSSSDDKRYYLPCGIHSLPYGHYRIVNKLETEELTCWKCI